MVLIYDQLYWPQYVVTAEAINYIFFFSDDAYSSELSDVHGGCDEVLEATDKSKFLRLKKHARTCR